ncbi:MAG TPA: magnesium chelatase domain-containing protein [Sphingobacteriaceae bacterium]
MKGQSYRLSKFIVESKQVALFVILSVYSTLLPKNTLYLRFPLINLHPTYADIKKSGTAFDLPIALGIMAASEQFDKSRIEQYVIMGELSLDGEVRPIKGALPIAIQARKEGFKGLIVPKSNAR